MALLDTQTAKELAAKSHEARRRNKQLREQAELEPQLEPQPEPQIAQPTDTPDISRIRAKLDKLDLLMDQAEDDRSWDTLSRAYERMFKVWMVLTKTPFSGSLKPTSPKSTQRRDLPDPTPIAPVAPVLPEQSKPA